MAMKKCVVDVSPIPLSSCSHERVLPHSPGGGSIRDISRPSLYLLLFRLLEKESNLSDEQDRERIAGYIHMFIASSLGEHLFFSLPLLSYMLRTAG